MRRGIDRHSEGRGGACLVSLAHRPFVNVGFWAPRSSLLAGSKGCFEGVIGLLSQNKDVATVK
ncbi:hypothetical protein [Prevotella sp.]|uniref:hypothetical protein n=1 Tax=Prevotella sp. TaxID=59823 RepID=UPI002F932506